jgi:WS/DGAT/MGAT family acyltransferase
MFIVPEWPAMKHLSALDALFLQLETPDTPMHVGSVMRMAAPKGVGRGRTAYDQIRRHMEGRLHLAPIFSRRLAFMPLDLANPIWIDAENVDLDYHIQRLCLPAPASDVKLEAAVAKLHEGMLDRDRPLWQFTVIEGLPNGEVGVYAKIHHAALDGQGGIAVAQALLDIQPKPARRAKAEAHAPRLPPSTARMIGAALRNTVAQYGRIAKSIPEALMSAGRGGAVALDPAALRKRGMALGPRTPLNHAIGPRRSFATTRIPLSEAKAIARHFDATLNDVVLATCAGALRRHFAADKASLAKAMIGAVPATLRAAGDTTASNYVTMMFVSLATNVADPVKRLAAIMAASARAKMLTGSLKGAIPTDLPSLGIPWLMSALTPLYQKAVATEKIPVIANLVISNVPGPPIPLYMAGGRVKAYFPVSAVAHGLALNITILSYDGSLDYGLVAAKEAMPKLRGFAGHLRSAHAELLAKAKAA